MKINFFKSIRWKLTLSFFGIIFVTLVSIALGMLIAASRPYGIKNEILMRTRTIAQVISKSVQKGKSPENLTIAVKDLRNLHLFSIRILDVNGKEVNRKDHNKDESPGNPLWKPIDLNEEEVAQIKKGQEIIGIKKHDKNHPSYLYSAAPLKKGDEIAGAVMFVYPLGHPKEVRQARMRTLLNHLLIAALIASIAAFLLARTLTKPIEKMEEAARSISRGDFSRKIDARRADELGLLTDSFDRMSETIENNIKGRMRMMADVSHELRTPLSSIQGCAEAVIDDVVETEEERKKYLQTIIDQTQRLSYLIKDLTELSRFEAGEVKVEKEPFAAESPLLKAVDSAKILADKKEIKLETEIQEKGLIVKGDSDRITQALLNLINNAVHHNPSGTEVKVSVRRSIRNAVYVVSDNGSGIPADEIDSIFERFHKVDKSRRRDDSGSGLGLAIVKEILKAHDSDVKVNSSKKGTTFSFVLPLAKP